MQCVTNEQNRPKRQNRCDRASETVAHQDDDSGVAEDSAQAAYNHKARESHGERPETRDSVT